MPVFALEKWTATKTGNGIITLTSWQSPTNLVSGFATGKKTEPEKDEDGNPKKTVILYEHRFTAKNVQLYPPLGGWVAYVDGPNRSQYVLGLSEKKRLHTAVSPPVLVVEPVPEVVLNTTTETPSSTATVVTTVPKYKKYGKKEQNSVHVKYVAKQTVDELHTTFGTVSPSQKKILEKSEY